MRDGEVFDRALGQALEENQFLARFDEHLVHRDASEDGSEGRDVAHGQSVGKFANIERGAEHIEVEGSSRVEHTDAAECEVLSAATAIAARLEVEAVVGRSEDAIVHIDFAYHTCRFGAEGDAAGATLGKTITDDDILGGTANAKSVLGTSRLECEAVVTTGQGAVFDQYVAGRFDVDAVGASTITIYGAATNDDRVAIDWSDVPEERLLKLHPFEQHVVAKNGREEHR